MDILLNQAFADMDTFLSTELLIIIMAGLGLALVIGFLGIFKRIVLTGHSFGNSDSPHGDDKK